MLVLIATSDRRASKHFMPILPIHNRKCCMHMKHVPFKFCDATFFCYFSTPSIEPVIYLLSSLLPPMLLHFLLLHRLTFFPPFHSNLCSFVCFVFFHLFFTSLYGGVRVCWLFSVQLSHVKNAPRHTNIHSMVMNHVDWCNLTREKNGAPLRQHTNKSNNAHILHVFMCDMSEF